MYKIIINKSNANNNNINLLKDWKKGTLENSRILIKKWVGLTQINKFLEWQGVSKSINGNEYKQDFKKGKLFKENEKMIEKWKRYNSDISKKSFNKYKKDVREMLNLGDYRSLRHKLGYTTRGQRLRTNGKTQRKLGKTRFILE